MEANPGRGQPPARPICWMLNSTNLRRQISHLFIFLTGPPRFHKYWFKFYIKALESYATLLATQFTGSFDKTSVTFVPIWFQLCRVILLLCNHWFGSCDAFKFTYMTNEFAQYVEVVKGAKWLYSTHYTYLSINPFGRSMIWFKCTQYLNISELFFLDSFNLYWT